MLTSIKRKKTNRVKEEMVLLDNPDEWNDGGYKGPFKISIAVFGILAKSSSQGAFILRSIRDGDMKLLQKSLDAAPDASDEEHETALYLACLYDRPGAVGTIITNRFGHALPAHIALQAIGFACKLNRMAVIESLLKYGVDLTHRCELNRTVMYCIARGSTVKVAEYLYDGHGIQPPVYATDVYKATPLHYAAQRGQADLCRWMLAHGANARARDTRGMTPVMYASQSGHVTVMTSLIEAGASPVHGCLSDTDDEKMTALHHTVANGRTEATHLLLSSKLVDVNATTEHGWTALHLCAVYNHAHLVSILVRSGANLEARDLANKTSLYRASENENLDVALNLINEGADINSVDDGGVFPLFVACAKGHVDLVTSLLNLGADYSLADHLGRTCLHAAVEHGHAEVVNALFETCHGSLLGMCDVMGMNALHIAAMKDNQQILERLVVYDEVVNVQDLVGMMPLHYAARFGTHTAVQLLADITKDINTETFDMRTAFLLACEADDTMSIVVLRKMGADINARDCFDRNALAIAASNGSTAIVRELIKAKVDINATDKRKNTALHYACVKGHLPTVQALIEHGASVKSVNFTGRQPFTEAVEAGNRDVAAFLMAHDSWEDSLSVYEYEGKMLLHSMIRYTPEALQVMLDKCVQTSPHQPHHKDYKVHVIYKYLAPSPEHNVTYCYKAFELLSQYGRKELLSHPVCQSLLTLKWRKYGRFTFLYYLIVQTTFYIILGAFIYTSPRLDLVLDDTGCNIDVMNTGNQTGNTTTVTQGNEDSQGSLCFTFNIALYVGIGLHFIKELRFIFALGWRYFLSVSNVSNIASLASITYALFPPGCQLCSTHWRLLAFAIMALSVSNSLVFMRLDIIGLYFSMFFEVARGILKISCLLMFFLFTLSLPLTIFLRHQDGFTSDFPAPLTVLAMTLGELNFRDNFVRANTSPFTIDLYVFFPIFALILPIIVMNLMIGVAVGDINKIENGAYLLRMKNKISFLKTVEYSLTSVMRHRFYFESFTFQPNAYTGTLKGQVKHWLLDAEQQGRGKELEKDENCTDIKGEIQRQNVMIEYLKDVTQSIEYKLNKLTETKTDGVNRNVSSISTPVVNHILVKEEEEEIRSKTI